MPSTPQTKPLIQQPTPEALAEAVAILKRGGLVAMPTETVYGLAADASNPEAIQRLYAVKGRPGNHPVIVHIARIEQLSDWAKEIPDAAWQLANAFWPGPLTLILPKVNGVLDAVTGGQDTVGIRIPSHPVAHSLLAQFNGGLAAPSANRFGHVSPTTAEHVLNDLNQDVDLILDGGACDVGVESTIVAFPNGNPVILRPGMITAEQVEAVLNQSVVQHQNENSIQAPGMLASHYAPQTPLDVLAWSELLSRVQTNMEQLGVLACKPSPTAMNTSVVWVEAPTNATSYAQTLYANLRKLDQMNLNRIYVEAVPQTMAWSAVADRLKRASHCE